MSSHTEAQKTLTPTSDFALLDAQAGHPPRSHPSARRRSRRALVLRSLVIADVVGLVAAYVVALVFVGAEAADAGTTPAALEVVVLVISLPLWIALGRLFGLYRRDDEHADHSTVDDFAGVCAVVTIGTWLFVAGAWLLDLANPYMPKLIAFWLGAVILVMLSRGIARAMWRRSPAYVQNTLILGADAIGQRVAAKILRHPEYGINVLGFIDSVQPTNGSVDSSPRPPLLGEPSELPGLAEALGVERVIVAFSQERLSELVAELRALRIRDVQVDLVPRFYDVVGPGADFHTVEGMPLVSLPRARLSASALLVKRVLDVAMSIAGLVCLSPLFAYLAIRVKLDSPGPVLFRHERVGRDGKRFRLAKFRTMYVAKKGSADAVPIAETGLAAEFERDFKLRDDPRVTPFGTWLRRTSLDELPQLWNVLRGDMSLIGPRPLVAAETARWEEAIADLLAVKPGITGYWQINGRSEADYTERIRLELSYVNNWSLGLDLAILAKTAGVLVSRRGAY